MKEEDINKRISITEISKDKDYIGYIWISNSDTPKEFHTAQSLENILKEITDNSNPFIVEGQLYYKTDKEEKSYSIKHSNGRHLVIEYDLKSIPNNYLFEEKEYIPNRIKAAKIKFRQYWITQKDEEKEKDKLCAGMEFLVPDALVFVGFDY